MLHHCDSCPDESLAREFLMEQLQNNNYSPSDSIKYKQWVSTDRSQLEDNEEDFDDFLTKLLSMLFQLREHHFIAKSQSNFSKKQKGTLNQDNCVLVLALLRITHLLSRTVPKTFTGIICKQPFIPLFCIM